MLRIHFNDFEVGKRDDPREINAPSTEAKIALKDNEALL